MTDEPETEAGRRRQAQPEQGEGLVESGPADIPGVQDAGPADVEEEAEGARPFSDRPDGRD
jgi:hypothetical protein